MSPVAPFSLIERDQRGAIKRVVPLQFIPARAIRNERNAVRRAA